MLINSKHVFHAIMLIFNCFFYVRRMSLAIALHQAQIENLDTMSGMCLETIGGLVDLWTLVFKQSNNFLVHYSALTQKNWMQARLCAQISADCAENEN